MTTTETTTSETIVLTFTPSLPCNLSNCEELTGVGQLSITSGDIQLTPQCPVHGLAWECSEQEQFTSVSRFVHHIFDGEGKARVLRVVTPEEAPGYQPYEDQEAPDLAWLVEWACNNKRKELYIVWNINELSFEVYQ